MRIAQINDFYALVGGSEKTLHRCAAGLKAAGHDVLVIHGDARAADAPGTAFLPGMARATLFRHAAIGRAIVRALADFHPDVVHFRNFDAPPVITAVGRRYPTVRTVHTPWTYCPAGVKYAPAAHKPCIFPFGWKCLVRHRRLGCDAREDGMRLGRGEMARRLAACFAFRRVDNGLPAVVVTSEWMKGMLAAAGLNASRVHVVPPPVDIPDDWAAVDGGPPRVAAVGRLSRTKGFDDLLRALALLPEEIGLTLVGEGAQRANLERLCAQLGLTGRVDFAGWVPYEKLAAVYREATVVAFPSVWCEAFGNVGAEALSHGRPVVAYNVGGIPEWLDDGETGFLAAPADPADMAAKIRTLVADRALARRMGAKGRAAVAEYSLARHVEKTLYVYARAIAGRRGGPDG